jgi:hypothetical protein
MQIERKAIQPAERLPHKPGACLGCPDCKGACWSLAEFLRVPEIVLHGRGAPGMTAAPVKQHLIDPRSASAATPAR